ncbi:diacylglycerol kinase zeta isoform X3 [Tachysurus ichikawai]
MMEGDGDRGEMSANLDPLVDGKDQATPGSASSSCSDLSTATPAVQPCPHPTRTFSGLRFFGRNLGICLWISAYLK